MNITRQMQGIVGRAFARIANVKELLANEAISCCRLVTREMNQPGRSELVKKCELCRTVTDLIPALGASQDDATEESRQVHCQCSPISGNLKIGS